ncbi:hypothetical protein EON67_07635 [archaeon]|nr:MAG: hypothetical protein EON67_07635 [archaeon]
MQLLDFMEPAMSAGGNVVDFHTVDIFPERWFELVLVLRTDNTILFDRLSARYVAGLRCCPACTQHPPCACTAMRVPCAMCYVPCARPSHSCSGYALNKVQENVEAEIMQVVLEDAHESYAAEIVQELPSNTMEDLDSNVSRVASWYAMWARDHPAGVE